MKILLINPSQYELYGGLQAPEHPPMGLSYIGAVLEANADQVRILDIDADKISKDEFINIIKTSGFDIVGVTTLTPSFSKAVLLTKIVKENSSAHTVLGGIHPTIMPADCLKPDSVDFVIIGEGEVTFKELVNCLKNGHDLSSVTGLGYKKNGNVIINKERELIPDLDSLPFPARHLFKNQNYTYPDALFYPTIPVMTSRGCPGSCTYCNTKNIFTKRFRARSALNVVDEFEHLVRKSGAKEIHIWDDNFTTIKNRVFEIRDEIKRRGLKLKFAFPNGLRIDFVNDEVFKALKDMGTYSVALGVESGNQRILNRISKNISLEDIRDKFKSARKAGLEIWAFFMIGLPGETKDTIADTIKFAIELDPDIAKFHILKPFPGTEVFDELYKDGLITDMNYDNYGIHTSPVHRLPTLSENDLLEWQNKAYKMFYLRPKKILFQLRRMSTWNRFKLNARTGFTLLKKMMVKR